MKIDSRDANVQKIALQKTVQASEKPAISNDIRNNTIQTSAKPSIESINKPSDTTPYQKSEMPVSEKVVLEAIEKANKAMSGANKEFTFSVHEETKQIMIKVLDKTTKEVLTEFPSEKVLDMVSKICEQAGIMFDERG